MKLKENNNLNNKKDFYWQTLESFIYLKVAGYGNKILNVFAIFFAVFYNTVGNFLEML